MSSKSTLFSTPCCHIYHDVDYSTGTRRELLCIDVSYETANDSELIEVEWKSDFAALIRAMLDSLDHDSLDRLCRANWAKNNEEAK